MESEFRVKETRKLLEDLKKNFQCTICLELFSQPVSTKCNHIFCQYCLTEMIGSKKKAKTARCPLCNTNVNKRGTHKNEVMGSLVSSVRELCNAFEDDCQSAGVDVMPLLSQRDPASQRKFELQRKSLEKVKMDTQKKISLFDFDLDQSQGTSSNTRPSLGQPGKKYSTCTAHNSSSVKNSKQEEQQKEDRRSKINNNKKKPSKSTKQKSPTKMRKLQSDKTPIKDFEFEKPSSTTKKFSDIQASTSTDDSNEYIALPNVNKIFIDDDVPPIPQDLGENTLIDESINQEACVSPDKHSSKSIDKIDSVIPDATNTVNMEELPVIEQFESEPDRVDERLSKVNKNESDKNVKTGTLKPETSEEKLSEEKLSEVELFRTKSEDILQIQPENIDPEHMDPEHIGPKIPQKQSPEPELVKQRVKTPFTILTKRNIGNKSENQPAPPAVKTDILHSDDKHELNNDVEKNQKNNIIEMPDRKEMESINMVSPFKHSKSEIENNEAVTARTDIKSNEISSPLKVNKSSPSRHLETSPFKSDTECSLSEGSTPTTPSSADYAEKVTSMWTKYESPNRDYCLFSNPSFTHQQSPLRARIQQKKLSENFPFKPKHEKAPVKKPNNELHINKPSALCATKSPVKVIRGKSPQAKEKHENNKTYQFTDNHPIEQAEDITFNRTEKVSFDLAEEMKVPNVNKGKSQQHTGGSYSEDCVIPPTPPVKKSKNFKSKDSIIKHNDTTLSTNHTKVTKLPEEINLEDFDDEPMEVFTNEKNLDNERDHEKAKLNTRVGNTKKLKELSQEIKGTIDSADVVFDIEACPAKPFRDTERDVIDIGSSIGETDLPTPANKDISRKSNILEEPIIDQIDIERPCENDTNVTANKKTVYDKTKSSDKDIYIGSSIDVNFDQSQPESLHEEENELFGEAHPSPFKNAPNQKMNKQADMFIGSSIGADFDQSGEEKTKNLFDQYQNDDERFPEPSPPPSPPQPPHMHVDGIPDETLLNQSPPLSQPQSSLLKNKPDSPFKKQSSPAKHPSSPEDNFPTSRKSSPLKRHTTPSTDSSISKNHVKALLNSSKRKRAKRISSSSDSDGEPDNPPSRGEKKKSTLISYTPPQFPNESESSDDEDDTLPQVPFKKKKLNTATVESVRSSYITPGQRFREDTTQNTSTNKSILHVSHEEIEDWKTKLRSPIHAPDDDDVTKRPSSPPFAPPIPVSQSTAIRKEKVTTKAGLPNVSRLSSPLTTYKKLPTPRKQNVSMERSLEETSPKVESTTKPLKPVIMTTRISRKLLSQCRLISQKFDIVYKNEFDHEVTHLVVNTDENNSLSKSGYTFKYLMALVSGLWIVNYKWLFASFKAQKLVKEDPYEVKGDPEFLHQLIPNLWRARFHRRNAKPLFHGFRFALLGRFENSPITKAQLIALLRQSKSDVIYSPSEMDCSSSQIDTVVITDDVKALTKEERVAMYNNKPNIFHPDWIVESIINCKVQDRSGHQINV
ncbi:titin homolog isoform X2 [Clytia hemisphaerica]|uniref:titin homolog isoform X2 n=1 Tax=Clytia hemisphaerica TaxID=252671 RepID=UPI0034D6FA2F